MRAFNTIFKFLFFISHHKFAVFFAYNKINMVLINSIAPKLHKTKCVVFFKPSRVCITEFEFTDDILVIQDKKFPKLLIYLRFFLNWKGDLYIPHHRVGRIISSLMSYCENIYYIDDGLDTYREVPKNFCISRLKPGTHYYFLDCGIVPASWTSKLELKPKTCVSKLSESKLPKYNLTSCNLLVVESPGVDDSVLDLQNYRDFTIWPHPARIKRNFGSRSEKKIDPHSFCLEKSLLSFDGTIVIGETFALIFIISQKHIKCEIILHLSAGSAANLESLLDQLRTDSRLKIVIGGSLTCDPAPKN